MRAYISYSLNDSEQYVLSILANILSEEGFLVSSGYNTVRQGGQFDLIDFNQINQSNLFIGIITDTGTENQWVLKEWGLASRIKIPAILLIEENVRIQGVLLNILNIVRFNRSRPEAAIKTVKQKIDQSKLLYANPQKNNNNAVAWVLGGIAAIALISLLSDEK
jgi:hypothetical protein